MYFFEAYRKAASAWAVWGYLGLHDVRVRYRRTLFGPLWHAITLAFWALGVGLVYSRLFSMDMNFYLPYLTAGFVLWGAITTSLVEGGYAFINSEGYIKQFPRPRQVYVLRFWLANMLVLMLGLAVYIVVALAVGRAIGPGTLWALPGIVVFALVALMHTSIFAHMTVFVRDLPHLASGLLQVLFFVTPVIFTAEMLAKRDLEFVYRFNPLWYVIEVVRQPLVNAESPAVEVWLICLGYLAALVILAACIERSSDRRIVYAL